MIISVPPFFNTVFFLEEANVGRQYAQLQNGKKQRQNSCLGNLLFEDHQWLGMLPSDTAIDSAPLNIHC